MYDAWENFSRKSPKADESIRGIRPELAAAVDECIDAAGQEWEPYWQRRLLNVGSFSALCFAADSLCFRLLSLEGHFLIYTIRPTLSIWAKL